MSAIDYSRYPRMPSTEIKHVPGDDGLPLFGQTFHFLRDYKGLVEQRYQKYGAISRGHILFQRGVALLGPDANERVLKNRDGEFSSQLAWNPLLDRLFPNGLMLLDGDEHRYDRRILQVAFKKASLEAYVDSMTPHLTGGIDNWPRDSYFGFQQHIKELLLETAAEVFLGIDIGPEAARINGAFVDAMQASMAVLKVRVPGTLWYRGLRGRRILEDFVTEHIASKREREGRDLFSQICHSRDEDGNSFSDQAVRDHIIFLLFAAHDTTTSTLCSIVYALAKYPDWQDRLRAECLAIGKDHPDYDDLGTMKDTQLVFREALRMFPPVPAIPRRTLVETEIFGYRLPANTSVSISPLFTHYMEDYWTAPERFDPERFSTDRAEDKKHFYQWVPFGGGAHKCLGLNFAELQAKLFLYHLLRRCRVSVKPGYEMPRSWVPLIFPADGLPLQLHKLDA